MEIEKIIEDLKNKKIAIHFNKTRKKNLMDMSIISNCLFEYDSFLEVTSSYEYLIGGEDAYFSDEYTEQDGELVSSSKIIKLFYEFYKSNRHSIEMNIDSHWISIKKESIKIGGERASAEEWRNFSDEEIVQINFFSLEWWKLNKNEILKTHEAAFITKKLQLATIKHEEDSYEVFDFYITEKSSNDKYLCNTFKGVVEGTAITYLSYDHMIYKVIQEPDFKFKCATRTAYPITE